VSTRSVAQHRQTAEPAGVEGNEKLTAMTGAILLAGFAVEGFTVLEVRRLLVLHIVVGALLIGPVVLKIASTVYRFARYYSGAAPYVRKGPPAPLLRVLGSCWQSSAQVPARGCSCTRPRSSCGSA